MATFTHDTAPTRYVQGGGTRFAYRRFGSSGRPPLVFFQHFMGTLDDHDPALSDAFAVDREVILFDNAGVASSSGTVPDTIEAMADDAITFTDALGLDTIDVVGHSMGGLVTQEVALASPDRDVPVSDQSIAAQGAALAAYGAAKDPSYAPLRASGFRSWSSTAATTS